MVGELQVDQWNVTRWGHEVMLLAQQKESRLRGTIMEKDVTGDSFTENRLAPRDTSIVTSAFAKTPIGISEHSVRYGVMSAFDVAYGLDQQEERSILTDARSAYAMNASQAIGRRFDDEIISGLIGTARTGRAGTGSMVSFPSTQTVAATFGGDSTLNHRKLLEAIRMFDTAEAGGMRYLALNATQASQLMRDERFVSTDFVSDPVLSTGMLGSYLGLRIIQLERIANENGNNVAIMFNHDSACLGVRQDLTVKMDQRPDNSYAWQIYVRMDLGAVRLEESRVVKIYSSPTA